MSNESYDIVVAGAGMSGLVAGLSAAESGARVLVLEKGGQVGGSMRLAHGFVGTFATIDEARRWVPEGDEMLQEVIVEGAEEARQWLASTGVGFGPLRDSSSREVPVYERGTAFDGEKLSSGFAGRLMEPPQLIPSMLKSLAEAGAAIRTHASLRSLLQSGDGAVTGVSAWLDGQLVDVHADAVILATGGFQGNPELVQQFITRNAHQVYVRAQPYSTGDGLQAALAAGATTTIGMHAFYGHALAAPPARISQRDILEATQRFGDLAVAINKQGLRFVDESCGRAEETLNEALATQPDAEALYIVDAAGAKIDFGLGTAAASLDRARAMGARVVEAATLEELAAQVASWGFDGRRTLQTLREYNESVEADPDALRPRRAGFRHPLVEPPFSAIAVRAGITFTSGGIAVDPGMAVVSRTNSGSTMPMSFPDSRDFLLEAIPGLFAAGADVGGVHVGGYMGGLATALVTGRIAGLSACEGR